MASIEDWAAKAARHVLNELTRYGPGALETPQGHGEARIAAIIATFAEPLVALLRESKREHYECAKEGEPEDTDEECRCGADTWNARVDSALGGSALLGADVAPGAATGEGPGAYYGQPPKRS